MYAQKYVNLIAGCMKCKEIIAKNSSNFVSILKYSNRAVIILIEQSVQYSN